MSIDEEKKTFVMKHTFTNVKNMEKKWHGSKLEKHFNIPWKIWMEPDNASSKVKIDFDCQKFVGKEKWSIDTTIKVKVLTANGEEVMTKNNIYNQSDSVFTIISEGPFGKYLVNGNFTIEFHVTINKMSGIKGIIRKFDDESAKKFSDVVLVVKEKKFHVLKHFLASHSNYFESLFFGKFEESKHSEIELKDIDVWDFQDFLEVIHGEAAIHEDNLLGILHLADMYDAKTVIRRCEDFLLRQSERDLKYKFDKAVKYNMDQLKEKCMSEIKSVEDLEKVMPEDVAHFNNKVLADLLKLAIGFAKKK